MAQPVKKKIQEAHSELIKDEPFYTLLVDGNSLLFTCMADTKVGSESGLHYGGVYQFLLQLKMIMSKRDFDYVYVFFDDEYSGWMRWNLYKPYKANRDKDYVSYGLSDYMKSFNAELKGMQDYLFKKSRDKKAKDNSEKTSADKWDEFIDANFDRERDILCKYFNELYIRWYIDEITEGDDLIAYYCKNRKKNELIYIISGDMDLSQLLEDGICIYNTQKKKYVTEKSFAETFGYPPSNTLVKKILTGDVSDNIGNIKGLSEEGFFKLMPEAKKRTVTLDDVKDRCRQLIDERVKAKKKPLKLHQNILEGVSNKPYDGDFYEINRKIIDLRNPLLSEDAKNEMDSMMYAPQDPTDRSFKNLYRMIEEDDITELRGDTSFSTFFSTFKKLEEKERKRYEKAM